MYRLLKRKLAEFIQWQTALGSGSIEIREALRGISSAQDATPSRITEIHEALRRHDATLSRITDELENIREGQSEHLEGIRRQLVSLQNRPDNFFRLYNDDREELRQRLMALKEAISDQVHKSRQLTDEWGVMTTGAASQQDRVPLDADRAFLTCRFLADQIVGDLLQPINGLQTALSKLVDMPQRYAYVGGHIGLGTTIFGHRLFIDMRDRQIAPHIATRGLWEPWNGRIFQALLKGGDTVVDVGSNVGYFVMLAAQLVGPSGHVVALEANPDIADLLKTSVEINGYADRVDVVAAAATDRQGCIPFITYQQHHGDGHVASDAPVHHHRGANTVEVPANTLDTIVGAAYDRVRLLHIDAEGSEPAVLRGAKNLVERSADLVILMEWGLATQGYLEELSWLSSVGFQFARVGHDMTFSSCTINELAQSDLCDVLCFRGDMPVSVVGS